MPAPVIRLLILLLSPTAISAVEPPAPLINHDLRVEMMPEQSMLRVEDEITLPDQVTTFDFLLHRDLTVETTTRGAVLERIDGPGARGLATAYRVHFENPGNSLKLIYGGRIHQPLAPIAGEHAGGREGSDGVISNAGIFLSGNSFWYPKLPGRLLSFSLRTRLPKGWSAVSQGAPLDGGAGWHERSPQDDIYLSAARFHRYGQPTPVAEAQVYLRSPDPDLAQRYLEATRDYLEFYQRLLGDYPYAKFALVENFWESGYGMPSFTLLGSRIIRFPFILHSSYPHEILHNWWGNGVYIDDTSGNWSEGLTAYLADHLLQEQAGKGAEYRRDNLRRYQDYVGAGEDFPLKEFRGRHGEISQAVGYGKTLMFMHMLRTQLGDRDFIRGLRLFYRDNLFRSAGYDELRSALEQVSGIDLEDVFTQWTTRTGAPALELSGASVERAANGYRIKGRLRQTQKQPAFKLLVPVYVQTRETPRPAPLLLTMNGRELSLDIHIQERPLRLSVDPGFDLFRQLAEGETPSSLGQLFGASEMTVVLPSAASRERKASYRKIVDAWSSRWPVLRVSWDEELERLPLSGNVWLMGLENRFLPDLITRLSDHSVEITGDSLTVEGERFAAPGTSIAMVVDHLGQGLGLLHIGQDQAAAGISRKLPHYGKYSYTLFNGTQPDILAKGQWPSRGSALSVPLAEEGRSLAPRFQRRPPLADFEDRDASIIGHAGQPQ